MKNAVWIITRIDSGISKLFPFCNILLCNIYISLGNHDILPTIRICNPLAYPTIKIIW